MRILWNMRSAVGNHGAEKMLSKVPIVDSWLTLRDAAQALRCAQRKGIAAEFSKKLSLFLGQRHVFLVNSGKAACYLILKVLSTLSDAREVVLPAFTASSLVVAIRKAGLVPILCDISLDDYGFDKDALLKTVSERTLAVLCVHLFGIPASGIKELKNKLPRNVFLVEDCAQAMGSTYAEAQVGSFSDASFYSFSRGKNCSLYSGGCIATREDLLAAKIEREMAYLDSTHGAGDFLKMLAIIAATQPLVYGMGYPLLARGKNVPPPEDFTVKKMGALQAAIGVGFFNKINALFAKRSAHAAYYMDGMRGVPSVRVPNLEAQAKAVFNRFPLLFNDGQRREVFARALWRAGMETSKMYEAPLHRIFPLGYPHDAFPRACFAAGHLLTLPVHPHVRGGDLEKAMEIVNSVPSS